MSKHTTLCLYGCLGMCVSWERRLCWKHESCFEQAGRPVKIGPCSHFAETFRWSCCSQKHSLSKPHAVAQHNFALV